MKKVLASLLVLASLASFGGIISYAQNFDDCINFAKRVLCNFPANEKCDNFEDCFKKSIDSFNNEPTDFEKYYNWKLYKGSIDYDPTKIIEPECKTIVKDLNNLLKGNNKISDEIPEFLYWDVILKDCGTDHFIKQVVLPIIDDYYPSLTEKCSEILLNK